MRRRAFRHPVILALGFGLGFGLGLPAASAQEATFDPKALDASVAGAAKSQKAAKKAKAAPATAATTGKPAGKTPDRQFGELEGWSPGKAPPKPAEKENAAAPARGAGVGVSPSGNMSVGLPF